MDEKDGQPIVDRERNETTAEQADRNWGELLQEMRVMETGAQILTAFLFTLPFQQRFTQLDKIERTSYLVLLLLAVTVTALLLAPVSLHRILFRHRLKRALVERTGWFVRVTLVGVGLLVAGAAALVFDMVAGRIAGVVVLGLLLLLVTSLWFLYPRIMNRAWR